ncbi:MAG: lytic transglycosylase [Gammaproteobacteria bacterium]|nr:MAG: lytic transglycosylase [Gammaproteobacteria bacterium]
MYLIKYFLAIVMASLISGCASMHTQIDDIDPNKKSEERLVHELPPVEEGVFPEDSLQRDEVDSGGTITTIDPQLAEVIRQEAADATGKPATSTAQASDTDGEPAQPQNKTAQPLATNLIDRLRNRFQLDLSQNNSRIRQQTKWYTTHPAYLNRAFRRSEKYLFYIVEEIERRNLPMELALLPIVESAFDPFAYSHGRASGLWQFIPGTGRMYGLEQDWWYDGRRDVIASTEAALRYLENLTNRFDGDYLLALASYNAGSGTTSKAIKKNRRRGKPIDFWSLTLPRETSQYVPKLIALAKLVNEPHKYGVSLPVIANKPYFDVVETGSQIDLAQAAKLADISIEELYRLNPGFNRWATRPKGPHRLVIPIDKVAVFKQNLAGFPDNRRLSWQRYKIKRGDSLIRIANKHHTTPAVIKQINKLRSNKIRAGRTILIPTAGASLDNYALSAAARLADKQTTQARLSGKSKVIYRVKRGDNFWDIARKFGVNHNKLARWNGMSPRDTLRPGKKLTIWTTQPKQMLVSMAKNQKGRPFIKKIDYRVRSGDSLARIAEKFNVRINDITGWNRIDPRRYLRPGQRLTLFVDITSY